MAYWTLRQSPSQRSLAHDAAKQTIRSRSREQNPDDHKWRKRRIRAVVYEIYSRFIGLIRPRTVRGLNQNSKRQTQNRTPWRAQSKSTTLDEVGLHPTEPFVAP